MIEAIMHEYVGRIFKHKRLGARVRVTAWDSLTDTVFYKQGDTIKQQYLCDFDDLFEHVGKAKYSDEELYKFSTKVLGEE